MDEQCVGVEDVVHIDAVLVEDDRAATRVAEGKGGVAGDTTVVAERDSSALEVVADEAESACAADVESLGAKVFVTLPMRKRSPVGIVPLRYLRPLRR